MRVRELNGITGDDYARSMRRTSRERFSEGASGAFFYFSVCDRFIVKTMTRDEFEVLMRILRDYVRYLEQHPHSLIMRFFGCHALSMYGNTMYFMVLSNVLNSRGATIHERYDLKGSWVHRHSVPLERGQMATCRHCNERYKVGRSVAHSQCPERPNQVHEPNIVLRDADWQYKLRLSADESKALGDMIVRDSEFLRRHSIMDYSLLLGIHRSKYLVDTTALEAGGAAMQAQAQAQQLPAQAPAKASARAPAPSLGAAQPQVPESGGSTPAFSPLPAGSLLPAATPHPSSMGAGAKATAFNVEDTPLHAPHFSLQAPPPLSLTSPAFAAGSSESAAAAAAQASAEPGAGTSLAGGVQLRVGAASLRRGAGEHIVPFFARHRGGLRAVVVEGPGLYFIGIVDVLQTYSWQKWFENFVKTRILMQSRDGISCVAPDPYAMRFRQRVINQLVDSYHHEDSEWTDTFDEADFE